MQGAFAGEINVAVFIAQTDADVASPPSRVLVAQRKSLCVERVIGRSAWARLVGGLDTLGLAAEALDQLANGSGAEAESLGDGGSRLAEARPLLDDLANAEREGCRHGNPRK